MDVLIFLSTLLKYPQNYLDHFLVSLIKKSRYYEKEWNRKSKYTLNYNLFFCCRKKRQSICM